MCAAPLPPGLADEVLRLFPQPVAVIGAVRDGEMGGLTAAWVTRVSIEPPLVLVSEGEEIEIDGGSLSKSRLKVAEATLPLLAASSARDEAMSAVTVPCAVGTRSKL